MDSSKASGKMPAKGIKLPPLVLPPLVNPPRARRPEMDLESMPRVSDATNVPEKWRRAAAKALAAERLRQPSSSRKKTMDLGAVAFKLIEGRTNIRRWIDHVMKKGSAGKDDDDVVKRRFHFNRGDCRYNTNASGDTGAMEDFNEVVEVDEARIETFVSQELVGHLTNSKTFNFSIFAIITFNSILIAMQTSTEITNRYSLTFALIDQIVLTIFIFEICLKWYYGFYAFWLGAWNILDFVVIFILVFGNNFTFLGSSRMLRLLRVLRAFRSVRSFSTSMESLSLVVDTILQSIPDMANVSLLLLVFMLVAAVIGVTIFGDDYVENFGNLLDALFVCFICVTEDGWVDILKDMRKSENANISFVSPIYFLFLIMIGAFIFSNLIVAVVVTNLEIVMREFMEEKNSEELFGSYITHTKAQASRKGANESSDNDEGDEEIVVAEENVDIMSIDPLLTVENEVVAGQRPIQIPEPRMPGVHRLARYAAVLVGLQEAMAEYRVIRTDLMRAADVLAELDQLLRTTLAAKQRDPNAQLLRAASLIPKASKMSEMYSHLNSGALQNMAMLGIVRASDRSSAAELTHRRVSAAILGDREQSDNEYQLHRMNQY